MDKIKFNKKPSLTGLCPCGSGKQYKRCHLNKTFDFLSEFSSVYLLKAIAGLSLLPENHGKNVRLDLIPIDILRKFNSKDAAPSHAAFRGFLDSKYPSHHHEDSPVNLFSDIITFYGGDHVIFPGITEGGNFTLSNLLATIIHSGTKFPEDFVIRCTKVALLILTISQKIATKLGYSRYEPGKASSELITVPEEKMLHRLQDAVYFTDSEIAEILKEHVLSEKTLLPFLIKTGKGDLDFKDVDDNPILTKPLLKVTGGYIVLSPTNLSYALTEYIMQDAASSKCIELVVKAYHSGIWNTVKFQLDKMGFSSLKIEGIELVNTDFSLASIFKFDENKIAYVQLIFDNGKNWQRKFVTVDDEKNEYSTSKNELIAKLHKLPGYENYKVFDIYILSTIGRVFGAMFKKIDNSTSLYAPASEFDALYGLRNIDAIDLWKFSVAKEHLNSALPGMNFSFVDSFKLYKDHNNSFYVSDEAPPTHIWITPGNGAELIHESKFNRDEHSALRIHNNNKVFVLVERKDKYAPIYLSVGDLQDGSPQLLVEGFRFPIWVKPHSSLEQTNRELRRIIWEFTDAIAYWLWQISPLTNKSYLALGGDPITISFNLLSPEKFKNIERGFKREPELADKFAIHVSASELTLSIPSEIIPYLYGTDNLADRALVSCLLVGFNQLLQLRGLPVISGEQIEQVIATAAPVGYKKKVHILDSNNNMLIAPRHITGHRYVQEHDVQMVLDSIVPGLGKNCPPIGEIIDKKEKLKLTGGIVMGVLLPALKHSIAKYEGVELLKYLIGLNESLIKHREDQRIQIPTRIACYVSVEQQITDLREQLLYQNRTTIAVRCLIEHIAAEQSTGSEIISITGVDELIAIMDQIIAWAMIGDQINFELFEFGLSVLPSKRIGTRKKEYKEVFDPYFASKTKEDVSDATKAYDQLFPEEKDIDGKEIPQNLDKAFINDFHISLSRICEFVDNLADIGFQQENPYAMMRKSELRNELKKTAQPFGDAEFDAAIEFLGLPYRGAVEKTPKGYDNIDISPWRYSRRLSLMRKPLVILDKDEKDNPLIYWGARQVLVSRMYLGDQIFSNRLRVSETGEVIKVLGKFATERGKKLVKAVVAAIKPEGLIIDTDVFIRPNGKFKNESDIGDIDVLIIDATNKMLISIECKSIAPSRNIKEMIEEVGKLFGSDSEKGWIERHTIRENWLKTNIGTVSKEYGIDLNGFQVKSIFVTQEDMLTPYLKNKTLAMPFATLYDLKNEGLNAIISRI